MLDRRPILTCLALGALPFAGACSGDGPSGDGFEQVRSDKPHDQAPTITAAEAETLATDNHALTLDLYHQLRAGQAADRGFAISAYSISSAFGMLYAGTVEPARSEMATTLHFSLPDERQYVAHNWLDAQLEARNLPTVRNPNGIEHPAVELHSANGVWLLDGYRDRISLDYLDLLAIHYDAGIRLAQFDTQPEAERVAINAWVAKRTAELIPELFPAGPIDSSTTMVLVNAVYLKAPWVEPFSEMETAAAAFHLLDGSQIEVEMMRKVDVKAAYGEGPGYQAVALPMRGDALELLVIVPEDLVAFEANLDVAALASLRASMIPAFVDTRLPKFELESQFELTPELQALGMVAPFVDDRSFDAILEQLGVIGAVVHQTVIKVDEQGTEAAAATGAVILESATEASASIVVDRPFLLAIRDKPTEMLLFFGRVLEP
jgi:serpin B